MNAENRETYLSWLALFASTGTLLCCALPIALVMLGFGAAVAALSSNFSFLVTLSLHKAWVFAASGALLAASGWVVLRPEQSCTIDPELDKPCRRRKWWNQRIFWLSIVVWIAGFVGAYLALPLRIWIET